eukprot:TRINITY_DN46965_c0_g1_i1.p1 TRINITY_DN46965_c0_g1~~TRINITY_DN46965_c0_g1_i1.p1  ORF type:complete len:194 (-),score=1.02 TRINITY_DN46965_c0_g1_i1:7-588(-)
MLHSSYNINSLIFTLSARAHQLVGADKTTLYLVDHNHQPPQLVVMQGELDLRLPLSTGVAGHVATTGLIVNIPDCYKDDRFSKSIDLKTGYHTKSMLCMPMFADETRKQVIGVLQLLNKLDDGFFLPADESILTVLLNIAGPIIAKSSFFKEKQSEVVSSTTVEEHPSRTKTKGSPISKKKLMTTLPGLAESE